MILLAVALAVAAYLAIWRRSRRGLVWLSIASLGYFYLSNAHTLGAVFERDLLSPREREARTTP